MRRGFLLAGVGLAVCSSLAWAAPESLLPPGFGDPPPAAAPTRAPARPPAASPSASPPPGTGTSSPVIQAIEGNTAVSSAQTSAAPAALPEGLPSLAELEAMEPDELDELFGLKAKFDIPPAARRQTREIGLLSGAEGGLALGALAGQPGSLVRAAMEGTRGPLVSRWGHILLRRTLASRLDAPKGIDPVDFAAMRAALLVRMGEANIARAMVQDVDSANYNLKMVNAAFDAYLASGDLLGMCPGARLHANLRKDPQWILAQSVCAAFAGEEKRATRDLNRALSRQLAPDIDVLLAQRFAGATGDGRRAVNIEWDDVDQLNPWRFSLATSLGVDVPDTLRSQAGRYYDRVAAQSPALSLQARATGADVAGGEGILSSAAMVDLYSQIGANPDISGEWAARSLHLRNAYVAPLPANRLHAMRNLWGNQPVYSRQVLTAYAAARFPVAEEFSEDAFDLIASMLAAGLDANAMRWAGQAPEGSMAWGLLALARPGGEGQVSSGAVDGFIGEDSSQNNRKARFLVAGLAGLERLDPEDTADFAEQLEMDLARQTRWSRMITLAADADNQALVSLLAGVGMQGDGWDKMSGRHLFHIVRSLHRVGLDAEARMIAAEAVARG